MHKFRFPTEFDRKVRFINNCVLKRFGRPMQSELRRDLMTKAIAIHRQLAISLSASIFFRMSRDVKISPPDLVKKCRRIVMVSGAAIILCDAITSHERDMTWPCKVMSRHSVT